MSGDSSPFGFDLRQRPNETVPYTIITTRWGSNPANVTAVLYDVSDDEVDVSATCLLGTVSVAGDVITLPLIRDLTKEHLYWLECEFDVPRGDQTAHLACYLQIQCVR